MDKKSDLIFMAFNLGVSAIEERQFATVKAASNYFYDLILTELSRQYADLTDKVAVLSYANYLTSIATLGYTLPLVGVYNENFKNKLIDLIMMNKPKEVSRFEYERASA
jgi:hypothetical protein